MKRNFFWLKFKAAQFLFTQKKIFQGFYFVRVNLKFCGNLYFSVIFFYIDFTLMNGEIFYFFDNFGSGMRFRFWQTYL